MFRRSTIYPPKNKLITIIVVRGIVNLTRVWQTGVMKTKTLRYQRHRFPSEIISHAVWLYLYVVRTIWTQGLR